MRLAAYGAVVAMLVGVGLVVWTARELGWRRALALTDEPRHAEDPRLVLGGPFRLVRHPEALGAILVLLGAAAARGTAVACIAAFAACFLIAVLVRRSERALLERFGEAYDRYRSAVPFLFPFSGRGGS